MFGAEDKHFWAKLLWPRSVLHQNDHQAHILSGMTRGHMSAESKLNKPELEFWATVRLCSGGLAKENPF